MPSASRQAPASGGYDPGEDFYEDDEPVAEVAAAFGRGEKFVTTRPGDCQVPCDPDCEIAPVHCQFRHVPRRKPDWHDPAACDAAADEAERRAIARRRPPHWAGEG
jgi:hypothetical protein